MYTYSSKSVSVVQTTWAVIYATLRSIKSFRWDIQNGKLGIKWVTV